MMTFDRMDKLKKKINFIFFPLKQSHKRDQISNSKLKQMGEI
jgi:hypothetical protein